MLLCLHVEFVFMLMPFTWLTDDLLKDNPPSKLRLSISAAQICLFCEKYENPRNLGIVRACADKSHLCSALKSFVNFYCLSQSEVSTDNRKVSTFFAFQHVRCRCSYRSYLYRFLITIF